MITNVSSLQRPPFASLRGGGGVTTAAQGASRTGADQETSASTDGNAATQDYKNAKGTDGTKGGKDAKSAKDAANNTKDTDRNGEKGDAFGLTDAEREQLEKLKSRDTEVRSHENAHQSAGGQFAGSPSYSYQTGPDGKRYAIGGEVSINVSPEQEPAATIAKMEQVKRAATAPAEPSPQDYRVAAEAERMMVEAQRELNSAKLDQMQGGAETDGKGAGKDGDTGTGTGQGGAGQGDEPKSRAAAAAAAVSAATQAYQTAAALARSSRPQSGIQA
jgi:hypothetical protein